MSRLLSGASLYVFPRFFSSLHSCEATFLFLLKNFGLEEGKESLLLDSEKAQKILDCSAVSIVANS